MEYLPITMTRETMTRIPQPDLPDGYSLRSFGPGDRDTWVRVWQDAEPFLTITHETFDDQFGADLPAMAKRCRFLVAPDGSDVGTATAWYTKKYQGKPWGRLHWVAIVPDHQRKGLAKPMLGSVMAQMIKCGHRRAMLDTQTTRLAAIKTYLDFGFKPDLSEDNAKYAWGLVRGALGDHKGLKGIRRKK